MTRELSQNQRRLAVLGVFGLFWGAFLAALGLALPLAALVVAFVVLAGVAALEGRALVTAAVPHARRTARRSIVRAQATDAALLRASRGVAGHARQIEWARHRATVEQRLHELRRAVAARRQPAPKPPGRREALRLNEQAAALRQDGRTDEALELGERALAIFRSLGDRHGEALTLNGIGLVQARSGDETGALDSYEMAAALLTELDDSHGAGRVLANLGALHRGQGHDEQARAAWHDALERLEPGTPEHDRTAEQLRLAS